MSESKIVVLDYSTGWTFVIPYDLNEYEDALECIMAYSKKHNLKLLINDINFMEVGEFLLKII